MPCCEQLTDRQPVNKLKLANLIGYVASYWLR